MIRIKPATDTTVNLSLAVMTAGVMMGHRAAVKPDPAAAETVTDTKATGAGSGTKTKMTPKPNQTLLEIYKKYKSDQSFSGMQTPLKKMCKNPCSILYNCRTGTIL